MSDLNSLLRSSAGRRRGVYAVVVVAALLVGALIAPAAYSATGDYAESDDKIAVITMPPLVADELTDEVHEDLEEARQNDSIEAVVLDVNSPGGALAATEELALDVERTAEEMPVVASVDSMAASGGYYVSAPADEIYANPGAIVGSVGIRYSHMGSSGPGSQITSGPDKDGGATEHDSIEMANVMVEGFYGTVLEHRGDDLELTKEELAYAKVYSSQQAVNNGMIDEIGTTDTAVQAAAEEAGLESYEIVELGFDSEQSLFPMFEVTDDGDVVDLNSEHANAKLDPAPGVDTPVFLALHGTVEGEQPVVTTAGGQPTVVQDDGNLETEVSP